MADAEEKFFSSLPDDFKGYMYRKLNWSPSEYFDGVVFWSRKDDEPLSLSKIIYGDVSNVNKIIRDFLYRIIGLWHDVPILVQFWAPITREGQCFLTTRNRPFALIKSFCYDYGVVEGLCGYRMICMDSKFDIDLDGGKTCEQHLPARVFKHQFPESTHNLEFYSITKYPQRDDALRCGVRQSVAFPVFESSTQSCVGVIEVVAPPEEDLICDSYFRYGIYEDFEMEGLISSFAFPHKDAGLVQVACHLQGLSLDDDKS